MVRARLLPAFLSLLLASALCIPAAFADSGLRAADSVETQASEIASGTCGTCTWIIDSDGLLTIKPTNGTSGVLSESDGLASSFPWWRWVLDEAQSGDGFWDNCPLKSVKIANGVKAGKSIQGLFSMNGLPFNYCHYDSIDLTGFDTSDTESMSELFRGTTIDERLIIDFDTSRVLDMSRMFMNANFKRGWSHSNASATWKTSSVTNMSSMFLGYGTGSSITYLNFVWDTSKVTDMTYLFYRESFVDWNIETLDNSNADCENMFADSFWKNSFKVGPKLDFSKLSTLPKLSSGDNWWSFSDQKWYTPEQVKANRSGVADTYYSSEVRNLANGSVSLSASSYAYDGKAKTPGVTVKAGSATLVKGTDYTVAYSNNVNAGTAKATVTGKGSYAGTLTKTFTIKKAANPLKVMGKSLSVKRGKAQVVRAAKAFKIAKASKGTVTYARIAKGSSKWLAVNEKTGAITVKKGAPRKTHKIKVNVKAAGNSNYKSATKSVTVKVRVK